MTLTAQLMVHPPQGRVPVRCSITATRARASVRTHVRRSCGTGLLSFGGSGARGGEGVISNRGL